MASTECSIHFKRLTPGDRREIAKACDCPADERHGCTREAMRCNGSVGKWQEINAAWRAERASNRLIEEKTAEPKQTPISRKSK